MMDIAGLITTSLAVSLDTLVVGLTLALKKAKVWHLLYITFICTAVCLISTLLGSLVQWKYEVLVGGGILILMGVVNMIRAVKEQEQTEVKGTSFLALTLLALVLSVDNASVAIVLAMMDYAPWAVTLAFGLTGLLLLLLAKLLVKTTVAKIVDKLFWLPPLILILLGTYKILQFFL